MNRYGQTGFRSPPLRAPFASLLPFTINESAAGKAKLAAADGWNDTQFVTLGKRCRIVALKLAVDGEYLHAGSVDIERLQGILNVGSLGQFDCAGAGRLVAEHAHEFDANAHVVFPFYDLVPT